MNAGLLRGPQAFLLSLPLPLPLALPPDGRHAVCGENSARAQSESGHGRVGASDAVMCCL